MKKLFLLLVLFFIAFAGFIKGPFLDTMANEEDSPIMSRYYTSLKLQDGDTLWSIAGNYAPKGNLSKRDYIEELKKINGLKGDTIHAGNYLTILYFAPEGL